MKENLSGGKVELPNSFASEIDTTKHGFIEASAGTGKTFTIVFLVIKILRELFFSEGETDKPLENRTGIESFLVLTFTEKAASELRSRIRQGIEQWIQTLEQEHRRMNPTDSEAFAAIEREREYFQLQRRKLDQAFISTIHGFCQRILSEYPLETGYPQISSLVPENTPAEEVLFLNMREEWAPLFKKEQAKSLVSTLRNRFDRGGLKGQGTTWEQNLLRLAVLKAAGRASLEIFPKEVNQELQKAITDQLTECKKRFSEFRTKQDRIYSLIDKSLKGKLEKNTVEFQDLLTRFEDLLETENFAEFEGIRTKFDEKKRTVQKIDLYGIDSFFLNEEIFPDAKNLNEYPEYQKSFRVLAQTYFSILNPSSYSIARMAETVQIEAGALKNRLNQITFNDMIHNLAGSLSSNVLLQTLRSRFRFGIIDEFQDTDSDQYSIFRKIFLENPQTDELRNLFLIGDPKQSIYGFRGADIGTYLSAKSEFETVFKEKAVVYKPLSINYRSLPGLIYSCNSLFSETNSDWFPIAESGFTHRISFTEVNPARSGSSKSRLFSDQSDRGSLNAYKLSFSNNQDILKKEMASFIAKEILHLLSEKSKLRIHKESSDKKSNGSKPTFRDFTVLIRESSDASPLEAAFSEAGIPYHYYKKTGLFASEEAFRFRSILASIGEQGSPDSFRKLILSDLFDVSVKDLDGYSEYSFDSKEKRLIESWRSLAKRRDFAKLFKSLLTETKLPSPHPKLPKEAWERRNSNYRQLSSILLEQASSQNLDFEGVLRYLDQKCSGGSEADETFFESEFEEEAVRIMTIHASKGLEFPFVFLMGGFSKYGKKNNFYTEYKRQDLLKDGTLKSVRVLDLDLNNADAHLAREKNEDKRLYYVAVTRAMYKFYFPLLSEKANRPLDLFYDAFQNMKVGANTDANFAEIEKQEEGDNYFVKRWGSPESLLSKKESIKEKNVEVADQHLPFGARDVYSWPKNVENRKTIMESYSSLSKSIVLHQIEVPQFESEETRIQPSEQISLTQDDATEEELTLDLPSSNKMGNLLHKILERIDFRSFRDYASPQELPEKIRSEVRNSLRVNRYGDGPQELESYTDTALKFLWNTLRSPLPNLHAIPSLAFLEQGDRLHETDFTLRFDNENSAGFDFLNGTIDLLFYADGRYWLLDWKSNRLENRPAVALAKTRQDPYDENSLKNVVQEEYQLQLDLYSMVLDQWLQFRFGKAYDPNLLGGMYYVFLRGTDPTRIGRGFFLEPLTREKIEKSRENIRLALSLKKRMILERE
ncbi:hypothetical protein CH373_06630 [Leptospira perolatii]|uniref:RecBCD enzyme subunit RecB n=1 Tax=Leptospira perolatii TaxID=2023191 RepID=A0A2M9ZPD5_9LEPT|nr:UvrD-helicase domain-containing protein [Leptospira perolatii]PJZ70617.1 hypothetical protein CH360_03490 [Leptospira perolatii]PJZ73829.1 hypothetical protein CH373_06630 [Leptospira perolatii]